jgi:hypothetical protein
MNFVCRKKIFKTYFQSILFIFLMFLFWQANAMAGVLIDDDVCLKGETIMLQAQTKDNFFPKGGELVEFIINEKSLGKNLSGGDGYAFREFTPARTGLYKISAKSKNESGNGFLLSLKKGSEIVFIDVEGSLFPPFSSTESMPGSQKVVKAISKRFNIVYMQSGMFSVITLKKWLVKNSFPESPVLSWKNGEIFDAISKKGIRIKYVIGSPAVIDSAREYKPKAFSFKEADFGDQVKDWEEIGKKMKLVIK